MTNEFSNIFFTYIIYLQYNFEQLWLKSLDQSKGVWFKINSLMSAKMFFTHFVIHIKSISHVALNLIITFS